MQFPLRTLKDADLTNKRVVLRVDFNVPITNGKVTNDRRIREAVPTIRHLLSKGAKITLLSHLGRPKGRDDSLSLRPVADELSKLLGVRVILIDEINEKTSEKIAQLGSREIALLENIRFHEGEEKNDSELSKLLSNLGDIFVSDAFGTAHRAHSSTTGISDHLPSYAGFLMEKELNFLHSLLRDIKRPYVVVLGGSKVSDKTALIEKFIEVADTVILGGALANSFLKAKGFEIGSSKFDSVEIANEILKKDRLNKILLPEDVVVLGKYGEKASTEDVSELKLENAIFDIGAKSATRFSDTIRKAKTVVFNGPLGLAEDERFKAGTIAVCKAIKSVDGIKVACGGDTAAFVENNGLSDCFSYISTGGGAFLEALEGKELPGIKNLVVQ